MGRKLTKVGKTKLLKKHICPDCRTQMESSANGKKFRCATKRCPSHSYRFNR